jgi:hypothetical protein
MQGMKLVTTYGKKLTDPLFLPLLLSTVPSLMEVRWLPSSGNLALTVILKPRKFYAFCKASGAYHKATF